MAGSAIDRGPAQAYARPVVTRIDLPSGTVTFLFTDVEGSTKLLHELGDAAYAGALADHRRLLRDAFVRHGGVEVDTQGDAFFVAFPTATGAIDAAVAFGEALEPGPIRVRVGIHTGTPLVTDEGYVGVDVHRAARIAAVGHGGQVLVSVATASVVGDGGLVDLGDHRLKDLPAPERLYQLGDGSFPPLKSVSPSNLPVPTTPFVGREREVAAASELLGDPATRLVSVVGPGGIGKTRLAIEASNESVSVFPGGVWWVALAPLRDAEVAEAEVATVLGIEDGATANLGTSVERRLQGRRTLLLLDNAEHLLPALAERIAALVGSAPSLVVLVTTRERLSLASERTFDVPVMTPDDAETFFLARARAVGSSVERSEALTSLLDRLDRLPLALQLAAARLRIFSVEQLSERLSARLDLLEGGRDTDPRQRTLRSTIEWSHDLLSEEERGVFRRLSVFAGGATLEAVQAVADGDVGTLQALLDKALVQRREGDAEPRFWMLESIREFATERAEEASELADLRARHATWFRDVAERADVAIRAGDPEEIHVAALEAEIGNLWAAVGFGLEASDCDLVRSIVAALPMYWIMRGRLAEARSWLDRALDLDPTEDDLRRRLLSATASIAALRGEHVAAVEAADEAARIATELGGATGRMEGLRERALAALLKNDFATAEPLYEELLDVGNGVGTSACRLNLATIANHTDRVDRADGLLRENLSFVRARGQSRCEATTLALMAETALRRDEASAAAEPARIAALRSSQIGDDPLLIYSLELVAASADEDARRAALLLGATASARARMELGPDDDEALVRGWAEARLADALAPDDLADAVEAGRSLDLPSALASVTEG
jgi:predicted ATPase/class 3 adenylate cyclase